MSSRRPPRATCGKTENLWAYHKNNDKPAPRASPTTAKPNLGRRHKVLKMKTDWAYAHDRCRGHISLFYSKHQSAYNIAYPTVKQNPQDGQPRVPHQCSPPATWGRETLSAVQKDPPRRQDDTQKIKANNLVSWHKAHNINNSMDTGQDWHPWTRPSFPEQDACENSGRDVPEHCRPGTTAHEQDRHWNYHRNVL